MYIRKVKETAVKALLKAAITGQPYNIFHYISKTINGGGQLKCHLMNWLP